MPIDGQVMTVQYLGMVMFLFLQEFNKTIKSRFTSGF